MKHFLYIANMTFIRSCWIIGNMELDFESFSAFALHCCFMWMHVVFSLRLFFSFKKLVPVWPHHLWIQTWLWKTECAILNPAFQRNQIKNVLLSSMTSSRPIKFFFCLVESPWNKVMKILRFYVLFNFYILNFFKFSVNF